MSSLSSRREWRPPSLPRIRGHEIAEEVDVPARRHSPVLRLGAIDTDVLLHEISTCNLHAARQLRVTPAIEAISRSGAAFVPWIKPSGFSLEERLGLAIVRVEDDR